VSLLPLRTAANSSPTWIDRALAGPQRPLNPWSRAATRGASFAVWWRPRRGSQSRAAASRANCSCRRASTPCRRSDVIWRMPVGTIVM